MADSHTRQAKRTPVSLKIKFKSATLDQFIERYSVDVSHGGIFIRTKDPLPVGTTMRFEFQLKDASPLITGEGTVVWTREHDPQRTGVAPGMGVRFDRLADSSQEVLEQILSQKASKAAAAESESKFTDMPTRVAPRPLVDDLAKESKPEGEGFDERGDATPLPNPMPFHSDADEFPDEAFEEATKVRSLDDLVAASASGDAAAIQSAQRRAAVDDEPAAGDAAAGELGFDPDAPTLDAPVDDEGAEVGDDDDTAQRVKVAPEEAGEAAEAAGEEPVDELAARREARKREADEPEADKPEAGPAPGEPAVQPDRAEAAERDRKAASAARAAAIAQPAVAQDEEATAIVSKVSIRDLEERKPSSEMRSSTSIALALVAVLLLVLGGGGYFLLTRAKSKSGAGSETTTPAGQVSGAAAAQSDQAAGAGADEADVTPDEAPDEAPDEIGDDATEAAANSAAVDEPEVELVEVEVRSEPKGATAELVDGDQSGPTPMTFEVDKSKSHTVRVSMPGYVTREITIEPDQSEPAEVALEVAPMIIRIKSTPEDAYVYVNGRRVPGHTPNEFEVPERWRNKRRFKVSVRKGGYEKLDVFVTADEFQSEDDATVRVVDETLARATRKPRSRQGDDSQSQQDSGSQSGDSSADDAAGDDGAGGDSAATPDDSAATPDDSAATPDDSAATPDDSAADTGDSPEPSDGAAPGDPSGESTGSAEAPEQSAG